MAAYDFESDEFQFGPADSDNDATGDGDSTDYAGIIGSSLEGVAAIIAAALGSDTPAPPSIVSGLAPSYKVPSKASTGPPVWVWAAGGGLALLLLMRSRR